MRTSIDWLLIGYQHQSLLRLLLHDKCQRQMFREIKRLCLIVVYDKRIISIVLYMECRELDMIDI